MGKDKEIDEGNSQVNRRHFFSKLSAGIGTLALGSLMIPDLFRKAGSSSESSGFTLDIPIIPFDFYEL